MGEAATPEKRAREQLEGEEPASEAIKKRRHHPAQVQPQRQLSYQCILTSLFEEEAAAAAACDGEEGDLSFLMAFLHGDLPSSSRDPSLLPPSDHTESTEEGRWDGEVLMRRLVAASDDELGILPTPRGDGGPCEGRREPAAEEPCRREVKVCGAENELVGARGGAEELRTEMDGATADNWNYYELLQPELLRSYSGRFP